MHPHGRALLAFHEGDGDATLIIRRDDGVEAALPVSHFFRKPADFTPLERAALARCQGHVLDVGAGSGLHSLVLQDRGLRVTAVDVVPEAVEIMAARGVRDARHSDVYTFQGGPFETVLLLGHGAGIAGDLQGLDRLLAHLRSLMASGGCALVHSLDVRTTSEPDHLAYHEANRRANRYVGLTRVQFEHAGRAGPFCEWLHVDPETLKDRAERGGWHFEIAHEDDTGDFLASLT